MEHLAFVNAVLGGFAFVFLGALITMDKPARIYAVAQVVVAIAAGFFLVATLGSTLMAARGTELGSVAYLRRPVSLSFLSGLLFLLISVGLTGWFRSRRLGIATTLIALCTAIGAWYMVIPFIR